jgi:hypothetical protein
VHTGILVDRDELRVRLRDATGKVITIPMAEIEEEVEGKTQGSPRRVEVAGGQ